MIRITAATPVIKKESAMEDSHATLLAIIQSIQRLRVATQKQQCLY